MADEKPEPGRLNRRAMLLAGSSFVAAGALLHAANAQTTAAPAVASGGERWQWQEAEHRRHLRR
jgi:hypothetical protein